MGMQETLHTGTEIGETLGIAHQLTGMALKSNQTEAARLLYVVQVDHTDPVTDTVVKTEYEVVATDRRPRRGTVLWDGPEEVERMLELRGSQ